VRGAHDPYNGAVPHPRHLSEGVRGGRWLNLAAIISWLVCGLPQFVAIAGGRAAGSPAALFVAAYVLYGAALLALLYLPDRRGRLFAPALLAVESICGLAVIYLGATHLGGTGATAALIVIVSAQAPYIFRARVAWALVAAHTIALTLMLVRAAPLDQLISLGLAIGGFQAFATASSLLALKEAASRQQLAAANEELRAAQALLAEKSRGDERLRISRDLHDTLGHHLTALSLQLDVASRLSDGKAAEHVQQAHAITRLLLADVRDVVSTLREPAGSDLVPALRVLTDAAFGLSVHLTLPPELRVDDADRADALIRCVQEIITNAARHAHARNVWIRIERGPEGITLRAHDDGRGAAQVAFGHGLLGMRERFAALAGSIEFSTRPDAGFEVRGFMPVSPTAS
jgi:signal transduction histidine kinase